MVVLQGYARTRQSNIPTWRASPAALAGPFEDYVRYSDRWIEEVLSEDDPAPPARPGDNAENTLVVPEIDDEGHFLMVSTPRFCTRRVTLTLGVGNSDP
ncbi:hypothetical protein BO85DRAFT_488274 [Aspergillus piperis CBS 112811]|uniref:Uncharacterized protein n=1 Tax=Aspergillus piperis CBS 112811 TaxID=1448313 RepID=A0A8G1VLF9_9EURO|nr:hypothetical protein BO85DRAFT_488274 [Aspergillus piperis CBS 112811]RAH57546.1 hypothetical protein BO85DRAFT_488274 [Aspergillus piperis CBS 112811]